MLFKCLVLIFCLTAICAQKGERQVSNRSPSRIWASRKGIPQASEPIEQVQEPITQERDREPEEDREVVVAAVPRRPALLPPPPRHQPAESDPGGHPAPEPYSFKYSVDDPETGAATSREETQDANGEIVGFYHLRDADGRMRRVDYTAGKDGFKAVINSNEEGLSARAPADVDIQLSAPVAVQPSYSPSVSRPVVVAPKYRPAPVVAPIAPNYRPVASETSIKSFGKPISSERFFQKLIPLSYQYSAPSIPAPIAPKPIPAPPQQATQRIEQVVEQKAEDPAEEAQISQQYETNEPSDTQEIVQQRNVDIEEAFESRPQQPTAPVKSISQPQFQYVAPQQPTAPVKSIAVPQYQYVAPQPVARPTGQYSPLLTQSFRERGIVSFQPINYQQTYQPTYQPSYQPSYQPNYQTYEAPITQVKEDISNTIQEPQPLESTKSIRPNCYN